MPGADRPEPQPAGSPQPSAPTPAEPEGGAPQPPAKHPLGRRLRWTLIGTVVAALVLGAAGGAGTALALHGTGAVSANASTASGCDTVHIARTVLPTVVTVSTVSASGASGVGSGEVIRANGYIVTNNHVISSAADGGEISVTFSNGATLPAELTGRDPRTDLAVLKVDANRSLPVLTFANSDRVVVGQPVVALGAPLGLSSTVTSGIVSALDRNVPVPSDGGTTTVLQGALQTDASINPGNSGGALVDCRGRLIGVNTAIATVPNEAGQGGGGSVGIGFAVPANLTALIATRIIRGEPLGHAYVGMQVAPVTTQSGQPVGLFVQAVSSDGPAEAAGLQVGDIITHVQGHRATDLSSISALVSTAQPGDRVSVTYVRDGSSHDTTITLGTQ
ncbi:S1C family serine protease [Gryllotalpicola protaetiae]|nr:trypsin-like peptidase domain-containing protein [Gryllotalpicola protaetiae]